MKRQAPVEFEVNQDNSHFKTRNHHARLLIPPPPGKKKMNGNVDKLARQLGCDKSGDPADRNVEGRTRKQLTKSKTDKRLKHQLKMAG
jgi:hypothetical protein